MIVVTQEELRVKDARALLLINNEISGLYKSVKFDYFTISAVADVLYNRFKDKKRDVILHTFVIYDDIKNLLRYELIMPARRNNETKEFAISTKIEYNGKLYEVVEQKFCDECSIKNICPNNDVAKNNYYNLLSRDERVKIFGECSPIKRKDNKSVVFKEIPINIK